MLRRTRMLVLLLFGMVCLPLNAADQPVRPNIVLVIVDDLRWDDLGCAGHPFSQTPNIDRIAAEGAMFRNAFITTPLCSPSRASILTSQYAHRHGIIDNTERGPQSHRLLTFPKVLQQSGYETSFVGKWHMGNDNTARPGFTHWYALQGQGKSYDSVVNDNGQTVQTAGYVTDILNAKSVAFVRQKHSQPFLLYLSHKAIHPETAQAADGKLSDPTASNFIPAQRHEALYAGVKLPRRPSFGIPPLDKPALQQSIAGLSPLGPETVSSDKSILNRLRMLASVDEGVGALRKALEETGQLDNTVFVVMGDHGYFYGEHGLSVERRLAYEESIRIPLLVRYPALVAAGATPEAMVLGMDIGSTFAELAQAKIPQGFQGKSLVPLLAGRKVDDWRSSFLIEYYTDTVFPRMHKLGYRAIRTDRWKYIHYLDQRGFDELYDLAADPYELANCINSPEASETLARLQSELERLYQSTSPSEN